MTEQREQLSNSNRIVPEAVPKIIELVAALKAGRGEVSKIGTEPEELPSIQLLTEIAARLVRAGENTFEAASKAWQLIDDCALVHRTKRREHIRKQEELLFKQIPRQVVYHDAARLITEEQRIDRASDKFQRFLKYYLLGGEKVENQEAYTSWLATASEYNLGQSGSLAEVFGQKPSTRIKEFKQSGMNAMHLQYMRKVYWDSRYQQFIRVVADPVEKSMSGRLGGRGRKKKD